MTAQRFRWFIVGAVVATAFVALVAAVRLARGADILSREFGWVERPRGGARYFTRIDSNGPTAGAVIDGDRLVAWNADTAVARAGTLFERYAAAPGERVTLTVERDGRLRTVDFVVGHRAWPISDWINFVANMLIWLGIALFIGLSRPADTLPRLAAEAAVVMSFLRLVLRFVPVGVISPIHVVIGFQFFSVLSAPRGVQPRWTRMALAVLYALALAGVVIRQPLNVAYLMAGPVVATELMARYAGLFSLNSTVMSFVYFAALAGIVVVTTWNYRRLEEPDQRRRIRWVVWGSALGLAPAVVWGALRVIGLENGGEGARVMQVYSGLVYWVNLAFLLVPITIAYAVVKHQLFDIRLIIRMGVRYLLAKRALQVILALPVASIVITFVRNQDRTIGAVLTESTPAIVAAIGAFIAILVREPLQDWIDRRFFRDQLDRDLVLMRLIERLDQTRSEREAAALVTNGISDALHPKAMQIWTRSAREMIVTYSSGSQEQAAPISIESPLLGYLERIGTSVDAEIAIASAPTAAETAWLRRAEVRMLLPLMGKDGRAHGLIALGEKRSEEPYGATDRKLLQAVGKQFGLVWENLHLERRVVEHQRIERDVLGAVDPTRRRFLKECPRCGRCYDNEGVLCDDDRETLVITLPVPRTLNGRYELRRLLGRGGMGSVYWATDAQLRRDVAVKVARGVASDADGARRFQREARAAAQLSHPNVIRIYDVGEVDAAADAVFLVMEHVLGHTLRAELKHGGALDGPTAAEWLDQILAGLSAAHAARIVHRDLKPENIIASRHPEHGLEVKILDFGLAKVHDPSAVQSQLTQTGVVLGTLGYMSPEQLTGAAVDVKSDIFAIGVITAEMLTGRRPFDNPTYAELFRAVLLEEYHLPGEDASRRVVDEMLQTCLAKEPAARPSADALRRALIPRLRALPSAERPVT
jgi:hypothetical protein